MKNSLEAESLRGYSVYDISIRYYNSGTDLAIANFKTKVYSVIKKTIEDAKKRATTEFRGEFPAQSIGEISFMTKINLDNCLF